MASLAQGTSHEIDYAGTWRQRQDGADANEREQCIGLEEHLILSSHHFVVRRHDPHSGAFSQGRNLRHSAGRVPPRWRYSSGAGTVSGPCRWEY